MKKILALLLALMLIFALAACNNNDNPNGDDPLNRDPGTSQGGEDNSGTQDGNQDIGGSAWPDNEFTKLVPKPSFTLQTPYADEKEFGVAFTDATTDQIKAYVEQVKAEGFTIGERIEEESAMGITYYSFSAKNADGYEVEIFSTSDSKGMLITSPNGTQGGNQGESQIVDGGEVGVSAPTSYELPTNVKLVMQSADGGTTTKMKIGNDYYYSSTFNGITSEKYFKYDAANDNYVFYTKYNGGEWTVDSFYTGDNANYDQMIKQSFGYTKLANGYANSNPNDGGYSITTTGRSQKIAGMDTKEYKTDASYNAETFWLTDSGICLGYSGTYTTDTATVWDTSVTSFGVDLP